MTPGDPDDAQGPVDGQAGQPSQPIAAAPSQPIAAAPSQPIAAAPSQPIAAAPSQPIVDSSSWGKYAPKAAVPAPAPREPSTAKRTATRNPVSPASLLAGGPVSHDDDWEAASVAKTMVTPASGTKTLAPGGAVPPSRPGIQRDKTQVPADDPHGSMMVPSGQSASAIPMVDIVDPDAAESMEAELVDVAADMLDASGAGESMTGEVVPSGEVPPGEADERALAASPSGGGLAMQVEPSPARVEPPRGQTVVGPAPTPAAMPAPMPAPMPSTVVPASEDTNPPVSGLDDDEPLPGESTKWLVAGLATLAAVALIGVGVGVIRARRANPEIAALIPETVQAGLVEAVSEAQTDTALQAVSSAHGELVPDDDAAVELDGDAPSQADEPEDSEVLGDEEADAEATDDQPDEPRRRRARRRRPRPEPDPEPEPQPEPEPEPEPEPQPEPEPEPPPPTAESLLSAAQSAFDEGDYAAAYDSGQQSNTMERNPETLTLMTRAACELGDRDLARAAFKDMSLAERRGLRRDCRQAGVRLGF